MTINPSVGAAALALALSIPALAGTVSPGTYASWTNLGPGGGFVDDSDPATTFGSYSSQVTNASASLTWSAAGSTFVGTANGGNQTRSVSRGIAIFSFAEAMDFSMVWDMSAIVANGNTVGWTLVDLSTGTDVYAVSFENLIGTTAGGLEPHASDALQTTIGAGDYLLAMAADCSAAGGSFSYSAAFTAAPAPGALSLLTLAGCTRSRRRRL